MNNKKTTIFQATKPFTFKLLLILFIFSALTACGGGSDDTDNIVPPGNNDETLITDDELKDSVVPIEVDQNISVAPLSGPPGTPLSISGLSIPDTALEQLSLFVGFNSAPLIPSKSGKVMTAIPLGAAGTDGKTLPKKPLSLYIYQYGELVATIEDAITVEALPEVRGSVQQVQNNYSKLSVELQRVSTQFFAEDSIESMVLDTYARQINDLINGDHEHSIKTILGNLEKDDPEAFAFVESILASAGYIDALDNFISEFQNFSYGGTPDVGTAIQTMKTASAALSNNLAGRSIHVHNNVVDTDLAEQMIALEQLTLIGATLIHDNAEQIGIAVGLLSGALSAASGGTLAIVGGVLSLFGAVMGVVDFLYNKVWLGTFPSKVTEFALNANGSTTGAGSIYNGVSFNIKVTNKPQPVGLNDLVSLTLAGMGISSGTSAIRSSIDAFSRSKAVTDAIAAGEKFSMNVSAALASNATLREEVADLIAFITGNAQAIFSAVASRVPNANLDQNIFSTGIVYAKEWNATITTPHLLNLVTTDSSVLDPIDGEIAWQAGYIPGVARVSAFTDPFYWGVAERSLETEISVLGDLALQVTVPENFNAEESFTVSVSGSYNGPHGVISIDDTATGNNGGNTGGSSGGVGALGFSARAHTTTEAPAVTNGLVEISVENGSSVAINRTLNAEGHTEFTITPDENVQSVKLNFKLTDQLGSEPVELPAEIFLNQVLPGSLFIEHEPLDAVGARAQEHLIKVSVSSTGVGSASVIANSKNDFKISTFLNSTNDYYLRAYYKTGTTRTDETSDRLEAMSSYDQFGGRIADFGDLKESKSDSGAISPDGSKTAIIEVLFKGNDPETGNRIYEPRLAIYNSAGLSLETFNHEALGLTSEFAGLDDIVQWLPDGRLIFAQIQFGADYLSGMTTLRTYSNGILGHLMTLPSVSCETVRLGSVRPQVSRDSRYLVLSCRDINTANESLVLIDTINISLTNLLSGTNFNSISGGSISSDNQFVTYSDSDQQGLHIYDIQNATTTSIFSVGSNIYSPTWGPENIYIYYIQDGILKRVNPSDPSNVVIHEIVTIGEGRSLIMGFGSQ